MSTIISTDARIAQSNVKESSASITASVSNLVSGKREDANVADFSVGSILTSKVGVLRTAILNAGQAKSLLETAKGALKAISDLLNQQKNLAVKSNDDSLSNNERAFLNQEFQALANEIDRIASNTEFNGKALLDGSISGEAGVDSTSDLTTENYGLSASNNFALAGSVATGNLNATAATYGENVLTFGAGSAGGVSMSLVIEDPDSGDVDTITFTTTTTAAGNAAAFVAAARDVDGTNTNEFNFIDNGDGTVTVKANKAGDYVDDYEFGGTAADSVTVVIGNNGTTGDILAANVDFDTNQSTSTDGTAGTFSAVEAYDVGTTRYSSVLTISGAVNSNAVVFEITDTQGVTEGVALGETVTLNFTTDGSAAVDEITNALVDLFNGQTSGLTNVTSVSIGGTAGTAAGGASAAARQAILDQFKVTVVDASAGTVLIEGARAGEYINDFEVQATTSAGATGWTLGGTNVAAAQVNISAVTTSVDGLNRSVTKATATHDDALIGNIENIYAQFTEGEGALTDDTRNYVNFFMEVNGVTYNSENVYLRAGLISASTLASKGDTIAAGTQITFSNPNGTRDTNGNLTDNAFVFTVGSSDITLADLSTVAKAQASITTIATNIETQLAATKITQQRSLDLEQIAPSTGDHRITAAVGTILEGLEGFDTTGDDITDYNQGDVTLISDSYSTTGTLGSITSFTVDRLTDTITTSINGTTYTAYLNSSTAPTQGGTRAYGTDILGNANKGAYNSTTKIIDLDDGTGGQSTAKLHFFTADTTDGNVLEVDLGNVTNYIQQIDISTEEGEAALESALNAVFAVSSNDSLSFQVGSDATDSIGVSIGSAKTNSLFVDENGVAVSIDITTIANSQTASDVLDRAINTTISLIADVDAAITSFDSAVLNNTSSLQNADAARSVLLDTDYSQESTTFAEARVKVDAAVAVLAQLNARVQNLLGLLQQ